MQRLASSRYGAMMACVGQMVMQAWQLPQCTLTDSLGGKAIST